MFRWQFRRLQFRSHSRIRLVLPPAEVVAAGGNLADRRRAVEEFLGPIISSDANGAIDDRAFSQRRTS